MKKSGVVKLAAASVLLVGSSPAFAYLDPVTGSFLVQGLIGGIAAVMVGIRSLRAKIVAFFSGLFGKTKKSDTPEA